MRTKHSLGRRNKTAVPETKQISVPAIESDIGVLEKLWSESDFPDPALLTDFRNQEFPEQDDRVCKVVGSLGETAALLARCPPPMAAIQECDSVAGIIARRGGVDEVSFALIMRHVQRVYSSSHGIVFRGGNSSLANATSNSSSSQNNRPSINSSSISHGSFSEGGGVDRFITEGLSTESGVNGSLASMKLGKRGRNYREVWDEEAFIERHSQAGCCLRVVTDWCDEFRDYSDRHDGYFRDTLVAVAQSAMLKAKKNMPLVLGTTRKRRCVESGISEGHDSVPFAAPAVPIAQQHPASWCLDIRSWCLDDSEVYVSSSSASSFERIHPASVRTAAVAPPCAAPPGSDNLLYADEDVDELNFFYESSQLLLHQLDTHNRVMFDSLQETVRQHAALDELRAQRRKLERTYHALYVQHVSRNLGRDAHAVPTRSAINLGHYFCSRVGEAQTRHQNDAISFGTSTQYEPNGSSSAEARNGLGISKIRDASDIAEPKAATMGMIQFRRRNLNHILLGACIAAHLPFGLDFVSRLREGDHVEVRRPGDVKTMKGVGGGAVGIGKHVDDADYNEEWSDWVACIVRSVIRDSGEFPRYVKVRPIGAHAAESFFVYLEDGQLNPPGTRISKSIFCALLGGREESVIKGPWSSSLLRQQANEKGHIYSEKEEIIMDSLNDPRRSSVVSTANAQVKIEPKDALPQPFWFPSERSRSIASKPGSTRGLQSHSKLRVPSLSGVTRGNVKGGSGSNAGNGACAADVSCRASSGGGGSSGVPVPQQQQQRGYLLAGWSGIGDDVGKRPAVSAHAKSLSSSASASTSSFSVNPPRSADGHALVDLAPKRPFALYKPVTAGPQSPSSVSLMASSSRHPGGAANAFASTSMMADQAPRATKFDLAKFISSNQLERSLRNVSVRMVQESYVSSHPQVLQRVAVAHQQQQQKSEYASSLFMSHDSSETLRHQHQSHEYLVTPPVIDGNVGVRIPQAPPLAAHAGNGAGAGNDHVALKVASGLAGGRS